jgi:hypothetical protein
MDLYRKTMRESGFDEQAIARNVDDTWVWRNIFVAETDAEAERLALEPFRIQQEFRMEMRKKVYAEQGLLLKQEAGPVARNQVQHSLLCGSPDTVAEAIHEIDKIGVGGLILVFRLGPMPHEVAMNSIRLFMEKVAPQFKRKSDAVMLCSALRIANAPYALPRRRCFKSTPIPTFPLKGKETTCPPLQGEG